jgi:hypothetical protein
LKPVGFYEVVGTLPPDSIDSKATSGSGSLKDGMKEWFDAAPSRITMQEAMTYLGVAVVTVIILVLMIVVLDRKRRRDRKLEFQRYLSTK